MGADSVPSRAGGSKDELETPLLPDARPDTGPGNDAAWPEVTSRFLSCLRALQMQESLQYCVYDSLEASRRSRHFCRNPEISSQAPCRRDPCRLSTQLVPSLTQKVSGSSLGLIVACIRFVNSAIIDQAQTLLNSCPLRAGDRSIPCPCISTQASRQSQVIQTEIYDVKSLLVPAEDRQHHAVSPRGQQIIIVRRGMMPPAIHCPHCNRQGPTIQYKVFTGSLSYHA